MAAKFGPMAARSDCRHGSYILKYTVQEPCIPRNADTLSPVRRHFRPDPHSKKTHRRSERNERHNTALIAGFAR